MNTQEGNKLIAEFMEAEVTQAYLEIKDYNQDGLLFYYPKDSAPGLFRNYSSAGILYHSSWDWLMPVVEKINNIFSSKGRELSNHSSEQKHLENPLDNPLHWKSWSYHYIHLSTDINYVFKKVVESIKWHNLQTPTP